MSEPQECPPGEHIWVRHPAQHWQCRRCPATRKKSDSKPVD